jgi:diguanylate cyclase (GGDEF)-like protein
MDARLRRPRGVAMAFLGLALVVAGPWVGWWTLLLLAGLIVSWKIVDSATTHARKPEWLIAAGWLMTVGGISVGAAGTGGATSPATTWLLVPALALPARFHKRGLYAGIVLTLAALAAVTLAPTAGEVADRPQLLIFPAALIAAAMAMSMALRSAEIQHRNEAVIDQLTGMLNRKALESRAVELQMQSRVSGQPIGLIVCDIDHFKQVNDQHGHAVGDLVLKEVAYRFRAELRAYDLAYRLGGEEFVILVPGATLKQTRRLAERLREVTAETPIEHVRVTASFGIAASASTGLDFHGVFAQADEALYRAKAAGRNRVCTADAPAFAALT